VDSMDHEAQTDGQYVPYAGQQGWGVAIFIVLLAAVLVFSAYSIHHATYKNPRDPTNIDPPVADTRAQPTP
jgi:hypothetical protein